MPTLLGTPSLVELPSGTSVSVPYPAGIRVGEKLIAFLAGPSNTVATVVPTGWTAHTSRAGNEVGANNALTVWERTADGTETGSVTMTGTGTAGRIAGVIFRISGADATTPFDVTTVVGAQTSNAAYNSPAIAPVTADSLLVHVISINSGATATISAAPAGLTQVITNPAPDNTTAGRKVYVYTEGRPTAGTTGTRAWTQTGTTQWTYVGFAFRPAATIAVPAEPTGPTGAWTAVFSDDFAGASLDTTKWTALDNWSMNGVQAMARNVSQSGGNLILTLESDTFGAAVSSDPFNSSSRYDVQVGDYVETRMYMPGDGSIIYNWPAFWTSGPNWPTAGEHDVAEVLAKQLAVNYHYGTTASPQQSGPWAQAGYWGNSWHTYGVHRKATSADVYWDGRLVRSYPTSDNGDGHTILLNVGVSGTPLITGAASQIKVDYVRAWRPTASITTPTVASPPPAWATTASGTTVSTASFTPPAGALLLSQSMFDTNNPARTEVTDTAIGSTSTWVKLQHQNAGLGLVDSNWATVTSSVATTIRTTWPATNDGALALFVITGQRATNPIVQSGKGVAAADGSITIPITPTTAGSKIFVSYCHFTGGGVPTSAQLTLYGSSTVNSTKASYVSGTLIDATTITLTGGLSGGAYNWVEVVPAGAAPVTATALSYSAEGGVVGATPTTSDTFSGDPFNVITPGAGTITFDSAHPAQGLRGLKFTTSTTAASPLVEWTSATIGAAVTTDYTRVYGWLPALPSAFTNVMRLYSGATAVGRLQISTTGTLRYFSDALATPASLGASTWSVPTGALFRLEMRVIHAATGSVDLRLFTGANVHGTTPDQTVTITGNTGTNADRVQFGVGAGNSLASYTIFLDEFGWSGVDWLGPAPASAGLTYEAAVLADNPKAFIVGQAGGGMVDRVGARAVTISGTPTVTTAPDGLPALKFDGGAFAQLADDDAFSVPTSGILTIEAWIRPDLNNFPGAQVDTNPDPATREGDYTHWIGKGRYTPTETEWAGRMYSRDRAGVNYLRANRISGYAFPPGGGLGAGSYFQDTVAPGEWIHWTLVIDTVNLGGDGWGTTTIYKNGVQRDQDSLGAPYNVVPTNTASPLFIGAAMGSYFTGVVDRVAIYDYKLSQARIAAHTTVMNTIQANSGSRTAVDFAGASDSVSVSLSMTRTAASSAGATDAVQTTLGKSIVDSAGATDSVTRIMAMVRSVEDWAPATDSVAWFIDRPDIEDYQFVFDTEPWLPFGLGQTIVVENFNPGTAETRNQDVLSPTSDVRWFGTDRRTPPTWTFDLYTDVQDAAQALGWVQNMEEIWDAEDVRSTPNAVMALRYKIGGRIRRVFGRPGDFTPIPSYVRTGRMHMTADFRLAEHTYYEDVEEIIRINTIPSDTSASGFTFPVTFPLTIGAQGDSPYVEMANVRGKRPTWIDVTFYGPSLDPWVQIGGQRWQLRGQLGGQDSIRMSGKPWQTGLLRNDGAWMAGMLGPQARLSQLRLKPGSYPVKYGAYDPTGTSRAEVAWRAAYGTM
jgi:hypothetical protein